MSLNRFRIVRWKNLTAEQKTRVEQDCLSRMPLESGVGDIGAYWKTHLEKNIDGVNDASKKGAAFVFFVDTHPVSVIAAEAYSKQKIVYFSALASSTHPAGLDFFSTTGRTPALELWIHGIHWAKEQRCEKVAISTPTKSAEKVLTVLHRIGAFDAERQILPTLPERIVPLAREAPASPVRPPRISPLKPPVSSHPKKPPRRP
jgi:hypothetical protein